MYCGIDDGSVVAAHSNQGIHHKGRGVKADDSAIASLCSRCHYELDQGSQLSRAERQRMWWSAHIKTVAQLLKRNLWPPGIPVPDTTTFPF